MIAPAAVAKASRWGVSVMGLHETQLKQSRYQVASCLAKRLHGKNVTIRRSCARDRGHACDVGQMNAAQQEQGTAPRRQGVRSDQQLK